MLEHVTCSILNTYIFNIVNIALPKVSTIALLYTWESEWVIGLGIPGPVIDRRAVSASGGRLCNYRRTPADQVL